MIDGPFKSIKLKNELKRLLRELLNSAVSDNERADIAEKGLIRELEKPENRKFLNNLIAISKTAQISLFPEAMLEKLLLLNAKTYFIADTQRYIKLRLKEFGGNIDEIIHEAIEKSKIGLINELKIRVDNECNRQRVIHGVKDGQVKLAREKNKQCWEIVKERNRSNSSETTRPRYGEMTGLEHGPTL